MKTGNYTAQNKSSLEICRLSTERGTLKNSMQERSTHYELIWITNMKSHHWIDLHKIEIEANQIFCVMPRQAHRCDNSNELEGYIIRFEPSFLEETLQPLDMPPTMTLLQLCSTSKEIVIEKPIISQLVQIVESMISELQQTNFLANEMVKRYFEIFIIFLTRQAKDKFSTSAKTRNTELVEEFTSLIEKHFKEKKMVSDYATQLCITPNYLNEIVKKITGHSAGYQIRQRIALEAKRQAVHSGLCMKEVAYQLGFSDAAHFSKFFKSNTGKNFSEFKKARFTFMLPVQA
jgi:AraC family transcriptional activator of pobA